VTNGLNEVPYSTRHARRRRPISALQLATLLALIALPATVLFPIIAEPTSSSSSTDQTYAPPAYNVTSHKISELCAWSAYHGKSHLQSKSIAAWTELRKSFREMTGH